MKPKINFCCMPKLFDINNNYISDVINKYYGGYEISSEPDFLFYSVCGIEHYMYKNCVKIFVTEEACSADFNECDYAITFDNMTFGDRFLKRPLWLEEQRFYNHYYEISDKAALNRKFCNFIYNNDSNGFGTEFRNRFAQILSKYKPIDCPGKVLNNMKTGLLDRFDCDWRKSKVEYLREYKFTISFENTSYPGYTTEKVLHPLIAHSVPIYWGDPLVEDVINKNAIINCNGYEENLEEIVEKIIEIDNDDEKYLNMLHEEPLCDNFNCNEIQEYEQFIKHIIDKGNKPYNRDPLNFAKRMSVNSMSRRQKIEYFLIKKN